MRIFGLGESWSFAVAQPVGDAVIGKRSQRRSARLVILHIQACAHAPTLACAQARTCAPVAPWVHLLVPAVAVVDTVASPFAAAEMVARLGLFGSDCLFVCLRTPTDRTDRT